MEAPTVLPLRERAALRDRLVLERLDEVLPRLMRRAGIDMWIVTCREYAEDPVFTTMAPSTWLSARRRTTLVMYDRGAGPVERLAVARYDAGAGFPAAWDPDAEPDGWARLAAIVRERDPRAIAVDRSEAFSHADGVSWSEMEALAAALDPEHRARLVSAERLAVGWLETRSPGEMELYPGVVRLARAIHHEGLTAAIDVGRTTTEDLEWWYRERIAAERLEAWFQPMVSVQRAADPEHSGSFAEEPGATAIEAGDFVHVDMGIRYLGLHTDCQQHAYVLRPGESRAPDGLRRGLAVGNRLQDLLLAEFADGRTGNEVLAAARAAAEAEGIVPSIYTHPLGLHGHAAGATIGLWDRQDGVPGPGDHPLQPDTVWSIELNATVPVPEWGGREVRFMLEEDAFFDGRRVTWLDGRQTEPILIG